MKSFLKPLTALTIAIVLSLILFTHSSPNSMQAKADDECVIGDVTVETEVLCWAANAVEFVIDNQLFSILEQEDLRDAVKHYRFYQLVMNELQ